MSFTLKSYIQYLFKRNKMIDKNSGSVAVENPKVTFYLLMEKNEFLKDVNDFKVRSHTVNGVSYDNFTFNGFLFEKQFGFMVFFKNNLITMISASVYGNTGETWANYSEDKELEKKDYS